MKAAVAFGCGLLFAVGLGFSGMLKPEKITAFLEFRDPALLFVMGPAVAIYLAAARSRRGPERPIDLPLVVGAALFGIGWGLTGVCPAPAVVNLVRPDTFFVTFMAAVLAGMALQSVVRRKSAQ